MSTSTLCRTLLRDPDYHHHHHQHTHFPEHHKNNNHHPSFSSTLLEEIYRSFDEEKEIRRSSSSDTYSRIKMMKNNHSNNYLERDNNRFAIDKWIENDKLILQRSAQFDSKSHRVPINHSSSISSSDSSSGIGGFSSSDTESPYGHSTSRPAKQKQNSLPLKPIRTTPEFHRKSYSDEIPAKNSKKKEGNLQRRALKLYGDLKKVKQPISPGGKLATFLNSIFNAKKAKTSSSSISTSASSPTISSNRRDLYSASTPSTASRSCLSKTPSSAGRFERRSVRFVDDEERDYRRNGNSDVAKRDSSTMANDEEFKLQIREKQRRVEEVAKELLKINYHTRKELTVNIISDDNTNKNKNRYNGQKFHNDVIIPGFEDDDEEDDEASCCSSDLFELENLLDIGLVDRYREELPVYETTHVGTNRAIANGLIL